MIPTKRKLHRKVCINKSKESRISYNYWLNFYIIDKKVGADGLSKKERRAQKVQGKNVVEGSTEQSQAGTSVGEAVKEKTKDSKGKDKNVEAVACKGASGDVQISGESKPKERGENISLFYDFSIVVCFYQKITFICV